MKDSKILSGTNNVKSETTSARNKFTDYIGYALYAFGCLGVEILLIMIESNIYGASSTSWRATATPESISTFGSGAPMLRRARCSPSAGSSSDCQPRTCRHPPDHAATVAKFNKSSVVQRGVFALGGVCGLGAAMGCLGGARVPTTARRPEPALWLQPDRRGYRAA